MHIRTEALILSVLLHGETGAIVRALTAEHGLQPGYIRGARSRQLRPVLQPANRVLGEWRARTEDQLAALTVELLHSRAPMFAQPLPAAALEWVTALTAVVLPEGQPYPRVYAALDAVIDAIEAAPAARGWAVALVRYELLVLAELGYGLRQSDMPGPLNSAGDYDWPDILTALRVTGRALSRDLLTERRAETLRARERLIDRLKRTVA
jgi:DNA repair protein RecO (recombination protein O)